MHSETYLHNMSIVKGYLDYADKFPLANRARDLNKTINRAKLSDVSFLVLVGFDSIQSYAAAPDHPITSLIENTLAVCFSMVPRDEDWRFPERRIILDAGVNGLSTAGSFLKWKYRHFEGIRSVSMSTKIFILLTAVYTFGKL